MAGESSRRRVVRGEWWYVSDSASVEESTWMGRDSHGFARFLTVSTLLYALLVNPHVRLAGVGGAMKSAK